MLTLWEAKRLQPGQYLVHVASGKRWRVNGMVRTWKRDPGRIMVPIKHGLYRYDYVTENTIGSFDYEWRYEKAQEEASCG